MLMRIQNCFTIVVAVLSCITFTFGSRRNQSPASCTTTGVETDCREKHLMEVPATISHSTQKLYMDGNPLKILKSNSFNLLPSLLNLSLINCHLSTLDPKSFVGLTNLTILNLSNNSIKSFPDLLFGADLKNLQYLYLKFNSISRISQNALDHLVKLKELHLEHNKLTAIHQHSFTKLAHIKWLSIDHNSLVTAYASWFTPITKTLTHLSLGHNPWVCDSKMCGYKNWTSAAHKKFSGAVDITCSKTNTSLKNIHSKTLCATNKIIVIASNAPKMPVKTVGLAATISLECPDKLSTSWKYSSKSKNGSFVPIKQDEKIKIAPGVLTITGTAKHDGGTYCCLDTVGDDLQHTPSGSPHSTPHCFSLKIKSQSFTKPASPSSGGGSGGASAAVIIIIIVILVLVVGVWYFRRKRRNYGLLSDESVFQPSYDDPVSQESSHISVHNGGTGDTTMMGEAYV
ncbi:uncharacterized protein LOC120332955 [Styela clava]